MEDETTSIRIPPRFLVVDDHPLIAEAMAHVLEMVVAGCAVVEANSMAQAREIFAMEDELDLVLLDRYLGNEDGVELILEIRAERPLTPVVMFTCETDADVIARCLGLGVSGYITKDLGTQKIVEALKIILNGGLFIPRHLVPALRPPEVAAGQSVSELSPTQKQFAKDMGLSDREVQVLTLLVTGAPNKAIARSLNISESTVKAHVSVILRVLRATNRSQAIMKTMTGGYYRK